MKQKSGYPLLTRDLSWLSFNARVLQEAADEQVSLLDRLRFLGIFSNNLDEFFRVRVAALNRMQTIDWVNAKMREEKPAKILTEIQQIVITQQKQFEEIYADILLAMKKKSISIVNERELTKSQVKFVESYFDERVRTNIAPLMIESIPELPILRDKSIYLACVLSQTDNSFMNSYSLIEVPTETLPRFIIIPSNSRKKYVILLEDVIRLCLPKLFAQFGFNSFEAYVIKLTRDAELDIDNDVDTDLITGIEKGLKNRKKGKALRLVYDKSIQKNLLNYLVGLLRIGKKDYRVPGGRIHNFKDFMQFPAEVFDLSVSRKPPFVLPQLCQPVRILDRLQKQDIMLHFPYHSFDSIIDLLRESAIDPYVESIQITAYRLARNSKIVHALLNAVRNGKKVLVVLELKARFDEEANLRWKRVLEEEGVKVVLSYPEQKIHAKICLITKRQNRKLTYFGFVSTGNLNEDTAKVYGDHCLLTGDVRILKEVALIFRYFQHRESTDLLARCQHLVVSPLNTRTFFLKKIRKEIANHKAGKPAGCIIKLNSLSDPILIEEMYKAAECGLKIQLIIRGICCAITEHKKWPHPIEAISIVDQYLEHSRAFYFVNNGKEEVFISSADWMSRNLDHRIEVTCPVYDPALIEEIKQILHLQLIENVKARRFDNSQSNQYVLKQSDEPVIRSQEKIYEMLFTQSFRNE
jgi:polyphosphate kinase